MAKPMLQAAFATSSLSSLLWDVLWTGAALIGVCALAIAVLRVLASRGIGVPGGVGTNRAEHDLHLEQKLHIGARQWLYLVRCGSQRFLLGGSESAGVRMLAQLDQSDPAAASDGMKQPSDAEATHD